MPGQPSAVQVVAPIPSYGNVFPTYTISDYVSIVPSPDSPNINETPWSVRATLNPPIFIPADSQVTINGTLSLTNVLQLHSGNNTLTVTVRPWIADIAANKRSHPPSRSDLFPLDVQFQPQTVLSAPCYLTILNATNALTQYVAAWRVGGAMPGSIDKSIPSVSLRTRSSTWDCFRHPSVFMKVTTQTQLILNAHCGLPIQSWNNTTPDAFSLGLAMSGPMINLPIPYDRMCRDGMNGSPAVSDNTAPNPPNAFTAPTYIRNPSNVSRDLIPGDYYMYPHEIVDCTPTPEYPIAYQQSGLFNPARQQWGATQLNSTVANSPADCNMFTCNFGALIPFDNSDLNLFSNAQNPYIFFVSNSFANNNLTYFPYLDPAMNSLIADWEPKFATNYIGATIVNTAMQTAKGNYATADGSGLGTGRSLRLPQQLPKNSSYAACFDGQPGQFYPGTLGDQFPHIETGLPVPPHEEHHVGFQNDIAFIPAVYGPYHIPYLNGLNNTGIAMVRANQQRFFQRPYTIAKGLDALIAPIGMPPLGQSRNPDVDCDQGGYCETQGPWGALAWLKLAAPPTTGLQQPPQTGADVSQILWNQVYWQNQPNSGVGLNSGGWRQRYQTVGCPSVAGLEPLLGYARVAPYLEVGFTSSSPYPRAEIRPKHNDAIPTGNCVEFKPRWVNLGGRAYGWTYNQNSQGYTDPFTVTAKFTFPPGNYTRLAFLTMVNNAFETGAYQTSFEYSFAPIPTEGDPTPPPFQPKKASLNNIGFDNTVHDVVWTNCSADSQSTAFPPHITNETLEPFSGRTANAWVGGARAPPPAVPLPPSFFTTSLPDTKAVTVFRAGQGTSIFSQLTLGWDGTYFIRGTVAPMVPPGGTGQSYTAGQPCVSASLGFYSCTPLDPQLVGVISTAAYQFLSPTTFVVGGQSAPIEPQYANFFQYVPLSGPAVVDQSDLRYLSNCFSQSFDVAFYGWDSAIKSGTGPIFLNSSNVTGAFDPHDTQSPDAPLTWYGWGPAIFTQNMPLTLKTLVRQNPILNPLARTTCEGPSGLSILAFGDASKTSDRAFLGLLGFAQPMTWTPLRPFYVHFKEGCEWSNDFNTQTNSWTPYEWVQTPDAYGYSRPYWWDEKQFQRYRQSASPWAEDVIFNEFSSAADALGLAHLAGAAAPNPYRYTNLWDSWSLGMDMMAVRASPRVALTSYRPADLTQVSEDSYLSNYTPNDNHTVHYLNTPPSDNPGLVVTNFIGVEGIAAAIPSDQWAEYAPLDSSYFPRSALSMANAISSYMPLDWTDGEAQSWGFGLLESWNFTGSYRAGSTEGNTSALCQIRWPPPLPQAESIGMMSASLNTWNVEGAPQTRTSSAPPSYYWNFHTFVGGGALLELPLNVMAQLQNASPVGNVAPPATPADALTSSYQPYTAFTWALDTLMCPMEKSRSWDYGPFVPPATYENPVTRALSTEPGTFFKYCDSEQLPANGVIIHGAFPNPATYPPAISGGVATAGNTLNPILYGNWKMFEDPALQVFPPPPDSDPDNPCVIANIAAFPQQYVANSGYDPTNVLISPYNFGNMWSDWNTKNYLGYKLGLYSSEAAPPSEAQNEFPGVTYTLWDGTTTDPNNAACAPWVNDLREPFATFPGALPWYEVSKTTMSIPTCYFPGLPAHLPNLLTPHGRLGHLPFRVQMPNWNMTHLQFESAGSDIENTPMDRNFCSGLYGGLHILCQIPNWSLTGPAILPISPSNPGFTADNQCKPYYSLATILSQVAIGVTPTGALSSPGVPALCGPISIRALYQDGTLRQMSRGGFEKGLMELHYLPGITRPRLRPWSPSEAIPGIAYVVTPVAWLSQLGRLVTNCDQYWSLGMAGRPSQLKLVSRGMTFPGVDHRQVGANTQSPPYSAAQKLFWQRLEKEIRTRSCRLYAFQRKVNLVEDGLAYSFTPANFSNLSTSGWRESTNAYAAADRYSGPLINTDTVTMVDPTSCTTTTNPIFPTFRAQIPTAPLVNQGTILARFKLGDSVQSRAIQQTRGGSFSDFLFLTLQVQPDSNLVNYNAQLAAPIASDYASYLSIELFTNQKLPLELCNVHAYSVVITPNVPTPRITQAGTAFSQEAFMNMASAGVFTQAPNPVPVSETLQQIPGNIPGSNGRENIVAQPVVSHRRYENAPIEQDLQGSVAPPIGNAGNAAPKDSAVSQSNPHGGGAAAQRAFENPQVETDDPSRIPNSSDPTMNTLGNEKRMRERTLAEHAQYYRHHLQKKRNEELAKSARIRAHHEHGGLNAKTPQQIFHQNRIAKEITAAEEKSRRVHKIMNDAGEVVGTYPTPAKHYSGLHELPDRLAAAKAKLARQKGEQKAAYEKRLQQEIEERAAAEMRTEVGDGQPLAMNTEAHTPRSEAELQVMAMRQKHLDDRKKQQEDQQRQDWLALSEKHRLEKSAMNTGAPAAKSTLPPLPLSYKDMPIAPPSHTPFFTQSDPRLDPPVNAPAAPTAPTTSTAPAPAADAEASKAAAALAAQQTKLVSETLQAVKEVKSGHAQATANARVTAANIASMFEQHTTQTHSTLSQIGSQLAAQLQEIRAEVGKLSSNPIGPRAANEPQAEELSKIRDSIGILMRDMHGISSALSANQLGQNATENAQIQLSDAQATIRALQETVATQQSQLDLASTDKEAALQQARDYHRQELDHHLRSSQQQLADFHQQQKEQLTANQQQIMEMNQRLGEKSIALRLITEERDALEARKGSFNSMDIQEHGAQEVVRLSERIGELEAQVNGMARDRSILEGRIAEANRLHDKDADEWMAEEERLKQSVESKEQRIQEFSQKLETALQESIASTHQKDQIVAELTLQLQAAQVEAQHLAQALQNAQTTSALGTAAEVAAAERQKKISAIRTSREARLASKKQNLPGSTTSAIARGSQRVEPLLQDAVAKDATAADSMAYARLSQPRIGITAVPPDVAARIHSGTMNALPTGQGEISTFAEFPYHGQQTDWFRQSRAEGATEQTAAVPSLARIDYARLDPANWKGDEGYSLSHAVAAAYSHASAPPRIPNSAEEAKQELRVRVAGHTLLTQLAANLSEQSESPIPFLSRHVLNFAHAASSAAWLTPDEQSAISDAGAQDAAEALNYFQTGSADGTFNARDLLAQQVGLHKAFDDDTAAKYSASVLQHEEHMRNTTAEADVKSIQSTFQAIEQRREQLAVDLGLVERAINEQEQKAVASQDPAEIEVLTEEIGHLEFIHDSLRQQEQTLSAHSSSTRKLMDEVRAAYVKRQLALQQYENIFTAHPNPATSAAFHSMIDTESRARPMTHLIPHGESLQHTPTPGLAPSDEVYRAIATRSAYSPYEGTPLTMDQLYSSPRMQEALRRSVYHGLDSPYSTDPLSIFDNKPELGAELLTTLVNPEAAVFDAQTDGSRPDWAIKRNPVNHLRTFRTA